MGKLKMPELMVTTWSYASSWNMRWWLLPVLGALGAAFLLPQMPTYRFDVEKHQTWRYQTLVAPFDFEVLRPVAELRQQIAAIEMGQEAYFWSDVEVARQQMQRFAQLVQRQRDISLHDEQYADLIQNTSKYQIFGQQLLEKLFQKGIVDAAQFPVGQEWVYVVHPNAEIKILSRQVLDVPSARMMLIDSLPFLPLRQPELILPLLEKCITPNLFLSDDLRLNAQKKKITALRNTGLSFQRGQVIVEKNEKISDEQWMAVQTLRELTAPHNMARVRWGYALLALLVLGALFYFFEVLTSPPLQRSTQIQILAAMLAIMLLVQLSGLLGNAVLLLLPVYMIPQLSGKYIGHVNSLAVGWAVWIMISFSINWGGVWLAIQGAGWICASIASAAMASLGKRMLWAVLTGIVMNMVWWAALLSDRLPTSLTAAEVPIFVMVSALIGLFLEPAVRLVHQSIRKK